MKECREYFASLGYDPAKMYGFAFLGAPSLKRQPILAKIDSLISHVEKSLNKIYGTAKEAKVA